MSVFHPYRERKLFLACNCLYCLCNLSQHYCLIVCNACSTYTWMITHYSIQQGTCLTLREINSGHGLHWRNHMLLRSNQAWRMITWPPEDPAEVPDQKKDLEMIRWHFWKCSVLIKSEKSVVLSPPPPPPPKDTGIQDSWWEKVKVKVSQSCLTLCDPLDCSP